MLMIALFLPLYSAWPGETWLNKGQINVQLLLLTIKYIQPQAFIRASSLPIHHPKENSPSASCSLDQIRNSKSRSALQRPVSSAQVFIFLLRLFTLKTNGRGPCPWHWKKEMSILISCLKHTLSPSESRLSVHLAGCGACACGEVGTLLSDVLLLCLFLHFVGRTFSNYSGDETRILWSWSTKIPSKEC